MSKRRQDRGASRRAPRAHRQHYVDRLHRRPCRWDAVVWEVAHSLAKRCAARRSLFAAGGMPLSQWEVPGVALMLARGFDAAFARQLWRDPDLSGATDAGSLDGPAFAGLAPVLATECYEPLLRKYAEDAADRYLPRPDPPLEQLAGQLANLTVDLLVTRCAPGGDLRASIVSPVEDATGHFPDNGEPADPASGSGRASLDIRGLQVRVHESDPPDLVKRKLLRFTTGSPWLAQELARRVEAAIDETEGDPDADLSDFDSARINAIDEFLYAPTRVDGKTPVELLIEQQPDMPEAQRRRLERWNDEAFNGLFQLLGADGMFLTLRDVRDGREYRAWASLPDDFYAMPLHTLVFTRLAPWDDHWVVSGAQQTFGEVGEEKLASIRRQLPVVLRRAPSTPAEEARERKARAIQLEQYQEWLKLFGSDEVLFDDGRKLRDAVNRFYHHWTYDVVNPENGLTTAQTYEREYGKPPPPVQVPIPRDLIDSDDVAVLMDPLTGMGFIEQYGTFRAAFISDAPPTPAQVRIVWSFLRDDTIEPSIFLRMRDRFPKRTEEVMRLVLRDRLFQLDRDLEPILRKFKGRAMRRPPRPGLTVVDHADVPAFLGEKRLRQSDANATAG